MRLLFLACLYRKKDEDRLLGLSNGILPLTANPLAWNLIDGLERCDYSVDIINTLPVGTYPTKFKKLFLQTQTWSHKDGSCNTEIGSINLPILKHFIWTFRARKFIKKWAEKSGNSTIIIMFPQQVFLSAIKDVPDNTKVVLIVPDLPQFCNPGEKKTTLTSLWISYSNKIIYRRMERVNQFVLLTEQMKNLLPIGKKPFIVVEGIAAETPSDEGACRECKRKILLYTGTLNYVFGIKKLLQAFSAIEGADYRLWLCGFGEASEEITELCESDKRVTFFGHVNKDRVHELQSQASIMVNPRTNEGEYTKYSFPSKTMEYMASGKPVIMYKLDGIPDEYDEYLYYVNGNSAEALRDKIIEVCSKTPEEISEFGMRAREWVLREKNSVVQAKKIVDMIEGV